MNMQNGLYKLVSDELTQWVLHKDSKTFKLPITLDEMLSMPVSKSRKIIDGILPLIDINISDLVAPIDTQEVWACGVTYMRSRQGRAEESGSANLYNLVYEAERPEIFFKASHTRVVTTGQNIGIRKDSGWDVPEAEVCLVINSSMEIFGFMAGNDMSSRSIEGENPLYLPQAKCYDKSCSLGSVIVPQWMVSSEVFEVTVDIRRNKASVFKGATSTANMRRSFRELVDWLGRSMSYPVGAIVMTGTGVVPERDFTLQAGDLVEISISNLGTLSNEVEVVGH
jgi:2-dehydro-3-deoxy-D-arabinonate dehydratase